MSPFSLVMPVVLAMLASGCLYGPAIECDPLANLTESECHQAAHAALAKVSNDGAATKVVVRSGCPRWQHCPSTVNRFFVSVEILFGGTDRQAVIAVNRNGWEAAEPLFSSQTPSTP
jgi:hypothetical protein